MLEVDACERLALGRRHDGARELVALQAFFDEALGQQQQAALGVDQCVDEFRVQVERLVGGEGPRGRGPDDGEGFFGERLQAKGRGQFFWLGADKTHIQRLRLLVGVLDFKLG